LSRSEQDKQRERERYNESAQQQLSSDQPLIRPRIEAISEGLRAPLVGYIQQIQSFISKDSRVLEIGAGTGAYTGTLLATGAEVYATDISFSSLQVIQNIYLHSNALKTEVVDMESLPFKDECFDVIASAGSLSYGDNQQVQDEVYRVLRRGGCFICLDSLNHNPIYRLNRWIHYRRGARTRSTLQRMPTLSLIDSYRNLFGKAEIYYFGAVSWALPLLTKILGESSAARLSDRLDRWFRVKKLAFKFVMVARKI